MKSATCAKNGPKKPAASSGTADSSIAAFINSTHRSRSATPIRNGKCLIFNRGCPRSSMYFGTPPNRNIRKSANRSSAPSQSPSGYIGPIKSSTRTRS